MLDYQRIQQHQLQRVQKTSPARGAQILVLGFALIILVGTVLLALPAATETPGALPWYQALFTAASATTVTGLTVVGTAPVFSLFGEIVILLLIQIGAVGFITLSVVLFRLIGRRVSIYDRILLTQALGVTDPAGIVRLTLMVLGITIGIELIGAAILFTQWVQLMDWPQAAYYSIFHAISAFCNAGFDLFEGLDDPILLASRSNAIIVLNLSLLITIGTLGIPVIYDLLVWPRDRYLSLLTRLIVPLTLLLIVLGTILLMIDETFAGGKALLIFSTEQRWLMALFTVVSSRTAGLTFIRMADLGQASQFVLLMLMFIGAAPASMGGGVGLASIAVVWVTLASAVRGHSVARAFGRTLPMETIFKAVAILTVSTILVAATTLILMLLTRDAEIFVIAFEVVSAFSNTGYSLGITSNFGLLAKLLLVFTMFWGRLGPLTLVVALAQRSRRSLVQYPEERIIIG